MKCASLIVDCRNDGPYLQIASNLGDKGSGLCLSLGMVLKPGPDRTIWSEKPRTAHFCGSFSLKNWSMEKKGTRANHGRTSRFWEPWSNRFSRFPASFWIWTLKKKKNKTTQKKKKYNCWEYIMSLCFFFFLQSTSRSSLSSKTLLLGESSFKFRLCSPSVMCVWQGESTRERES